MPTQSTARPCNRCRKPERVEGELLCAPCMKAVAAVWNGGEYARWEWAATQ
jgi:hypothetical protein